MSEMLDEILNDLDGELEAKAKNVHTESYSMSIGEIKNLYDDGELDLHPEFQRFFRWTEEQKFKLIESILLGIPLPSFFVYQRADGVWDVVDGLQRLSTIFEFMGALKDENGKLIQPLKMEGTKYLPSLAGKSWEGQTPEVSISGALKRDFKRKKLDFNIILKHSDNTAKYDLFERLNTGGSSASSQEVRNAILIRENNDVFKLLDGLASADNFVDTTNLSESLVEERFDLELVTRFIILKDLDLKVLAKTTAADYLTDELIERAKGKNYDWKAQAEIFTRTFDLIKAGIGDSAFRKYNTKKQRFEGGFVVSAFEVIAMGIAYNIDKVKPEDINTRAIEFWTAKENGDIKWSGRNTTNRLSKTLQFGRELFAR